MTEPEAESGAVDSSGEPSSALFGTGDFFQVGNYAPVADELTAFDLPVEGAIPPELEGWYLRN
ncbi:9-cis-epoxycarotenoid dioxygenase, partial [Mycobacterium sp. ITM-2017-0098]